MFFVITMLFIFDSLVWYLLIISLLKMEINYIVSAHVQTVTKLKQFPNVNIAVWNIYKLFL